MATRLLPLVLVVFLAVPAAAQTGPSDTPAGKRAQSQHLLSGIAHFDRAFYELTPQKRDAEARVEFDLAVAAFEREIGSRPAEPDAHRYLARIHAARKEFKAAAAEYDALARLAPSDVDACVLAALAYIDAGDPVAARLRLAGARERTLDPAILARLDEYVAKVDALIR